MKKEIIHATKSINGFNATRKILLTSRAGLLLLLPLIISLFVFQGWFVASDAEGAVTNLQQFPSTPQMTATTGNLSGTFTISSGPNRLFVVVVSAANNNGSTMTFAATYGGVALTQAATSTSGSQKSSTWIGYLDETGISSKTSDDVAVTITGSHTGAIGYMASYQNVSQSAPITANGGYYFDNTSTTAIGPLAANTGGYGIYIWGGQNTVTRTSDTEAYTEHSDLQTTYGNLKDFGVCSKAISASTNPTITWSGNVNLASLSLVTLNWAVPAVTATSPNIKARGSSQATVTITGANFGAGAAVSFNDSQITVGTVTVVSPTTITVPVTVGASATLGAHDVTVTNTDGGSGTGTGVFVVFGPPTVSSTTPNIRGQGAVSQNITITGTNFLSSATASFSGTGITVNSTTYVSATSLTANITIASNATTDGRNVTVNNNDGAGTGTGTNVFTVSASPTVTSTSPNSRGQGATNKNITIYGTNFASGATASFSGTGITVNSTTFTNSTIVTANVTIAAGAATGSRNVTVTNLDAGVGTGTNVFTVNAAPAVTSVTPNSKPQGVSNQNITITGTGFVSGAGLAASFSGTGITVNSTTYVSATSLTANITIAESATAGSRDVTVTNPDGGAGTGTGAFTVNAGPKVTSTTPNSRLQGSSNQNITITGTGFVSGAGLAASFSGTGITVNSTTYVSATSLTANITIAGNATTGSRNVTVTNPDGGAGTGTGVFTVTSPPTVISASPNQRAQNTALTTVTITGAGFQAGATVSFNDANITLGAVTVVNATTITLPVTVTASAALGAHNVTVTNLDGGVGTGTGVFTVNVNTTPTVSSATPNSRGQGTSNQNITITGTNFRSNATASFSGTGITVNSTTYVSATSLTANITVAAGAATGLRSVTVNNNDGSTAGTGTNVFTVNASPTVTSTTPNSRLQGSSNQNITITGTGFVSGSGLAASFSGTGITVNSTTYVSATSLTANITIAESAATGSRNVTVTNSDGGTGTGTGVFTVNAGPKVTSTSPNTRGRNSAQTTVTITGTGFAGGATVNFNDAGITQGAVTVVNATTITLPVTVTVTATPGAHNVSVTNTDGGAGTGSQVFTVTAAPSVASASPNQRPRGSAQTTVTITGTGFASGAAVSFNDANITLGAVTVVNSSTITLPVTVTGTATVGSHNVTVTNADGGTATGTGVFTVTNAPTVTYTSPNALAQGSAPTTVTITGTGFAAGSTVSFNDAGITLGAVTVVNATTITLPVTVTATAAAGSHNVTVTNADGGSGTGTAVFTVGTSTYGSVPYWDNGAGAVFAPQQWPTEAQWVPYTWGSAFIKDPRVLDPSNGGTRPQNYVNVSSGCPDQSLPSMYVYYANNTLYFRWRVEQIPNTYATGPGPGAFSDVDPWKAAQWTVFLDTDGDGFREFGMQLDGSTGMPAWPVDILRTVYSNTLDHNMSPHDRDIFELWHNPTAFVDGTSGSTTDTILNFHGTNAPDTSWPNGPAEVVWDYGTTRAINITDYDPRLSIDKGISGAQQCGLTQENEYFVDYQIPVGMLSNGSYNFDCQNPTGLFFATANSLTNPFQKDVVANTGYTGASENCAPYGDQVVLCGPTGPTMVPQPVVDWVTTSTSGCNQTLTAKVRGSVVQSSCSPDITGADFYYYYDANANGLADDGGAWHLLGAGSKSSTDQTNWTYLWNTTGSGLPAGNYLVGVDTVNSIGYHTWSYSSTPIGVSPPNFANPSPKPGLVYGSTLLTGACGETAIVDKTVTPGKTIINSTVQFTITVHNNTSGDMQVNSVTDYLPQGVDGYSFAYISSPAPTGTGALSAPGAPTVSGTTVTWNFSPARTISAGQNATITFTSQAPSVEGTYQNTCGANAYVTSWGMTKNINCNYVTIEVGAPRLTIAKTADVTSRAVGETINYTVTYSNDSPFTATGAYITDVLPAGLTFVSAANDGTYNSSNRTITWYIGTIYGGTGPFTVSFVATVTNPYPATEPIKLKNVATIYSNETTPKQADVTVIITGLSRPILTIQKIGNKVFVDPTQASPADRVTYTISYSNVGNATATNSIISDTVPPGWTYVSSAAGTNCPAGTTTGNPVTLINWNLGSVAVGVTGTCNLILRAADSQSSPYTGDNPSTNTASIRADGFPPVSSSFTVALTGAMQCTGTKYFFHEETTNVGYDGVKEIATVSYPSSGAAAYKHVNWMSQGCDIGSYSPIVDFYMDPVLVNTGTASSVTSSWYLTKTNGNPSNVKVSVYDYNPTDGNKTLLASVVHSIKGASQTPSLDSDTFILNQAPLAGHRLYWLYEGCTTAQNQILDVYYYYDGIYTDSNSTVPTPSHFCYQGTSALMNKTVDKMTAIPGDTLTYTMTFGNNGATNLTGAQITDTLPTGTTYVSATLNGAATTCSQAGQIITCGVRSNETPAPAVGTITVGQQGTLVIIATVNNPFPAGQYELINSATLTTSQAAPITATARTVVTTDISISKSVDKTLLYPGDMATFTLSVKNSSGANITVNIGDVLPTDTYFYYVGCSDACGWDSVSHTVTWTNITVNANSSRSVTFQMRVDTVGVPIGTTYKDNTGVVTYGSQQYSNTVTVAILNNPNINITKSVSPAGPVKAGDMITWNMTVTNNGPQSAFGVLVTDPIIPYTTYKTGSLTYELTAQTDANDSPTDTSYYDAVNDRVVYEVGTLAGGASRTMSFSAIVDRPMPSGTTVLTNTATVSSSNTGTKQATATINVTDAPSFVLNKYAASLVASGQNVTFTVYYKNTGGATATSAVVTDTLAANLTFVSADEGGTYDSGTRTVTWNLGTLPPDAEGSLHLTVTPAVCGTYSNTATISSAQTAPLNSNITSTDVCWLEPTKKTTTDPTLMTVTNTSTGTLATYILTVSNPTGTTATGVQVTDNFPSGFSYDSSVTPVFGGTGTNRTALVNPSNGATHPTWGTWDINAGGSLTIAFTAKVASTVPEGIYDNGVAATSTNNSVMLFDELATAADDVKVVVPVDLSVTKTVNIAEPQGTGPGAEFVYTITLTNVGVNHAFKVNLSDLLPSDITYVSNTASQGSYSNATGIWDVGRVDRYAGATLTITAFPNDGTAGMTIDNCAYLTSSVPREPSYSDPDDWSCASIKPTHVTLSGFRAFVEGGSVVVEWETAAERNTVGFYVERYHEKTGEYVRVNKKLLPGLITSRAGGTYRLIDEAAPASGRLLYRLLEVESKGNKVTYGPFHVDLGGSALKIEKKFVSDGAIEVTIRRKVVSSTRPADLSRQGFEQVTGVYSRKAHRPSPQTAGRFAAAKAGASAVQPAAVQAGTAIKMAVSETGLYYIDASDISALLNITQSSVRARIGAGDFALTTGGRQVAYTGAEGNAGIFFYGKALESVYTGANIYWIKEGRGLLMQTVGGDKETLEGVAADAFADTIHAEQDVWSDTSLAKDPNSDYWYWDYVMADYPGFDYKEFSFRADSVSAATGTATIGARLQSIVPFRSRAVITLNGSTTIFDGIWDGLDPKTVVANIDQGLLREGDNIIGVRAMLESGVDFSAFYIDSFDVTYARRFEAVNDSLSFRSEGSPVITVDGFTTPDISVFEITNSQRPRLVTAAEVLDQGGASYSVRFYPVRTAASYIAVTTGSIKRADAAADRPSDLRKNDNAAEYVVIAPAELKDAVAGLAEYRRGQGMTVKVAMLEDIMDEFNFGVSDPNAIRTFLEYAYKNWKKKPRYAALAGSGTFDYKNYGGYGGNLIPALMVGSPWGLSPSDNVLGDFNNDDVPEIIVGRLPVLSSAELQVLINKIMTFEASHSEGTILIADKADGGGDFPKDSNEIAGLFTAGYPLQRIYLQENQLAQARKSLFDGMKAGTKFINYLGHGTVERLSEGGLLTKDDAAGLINSAYPVMTALTCSSGHYALPGFDALMEALIIRNGGGIVSSWAPTDWSYNADAKILGEGFYKAVFRPVVTTMGDAVTRAMTAYKASGRASYELNIFNIIGDPALRLK